jgi:hypothetical protein
MILLGIGYWFSPVDKQLDTRTKNVKASLSNWLDGKVGGGARVASRVAYDLL